MCGRRKERDKAQMIALNMRLMLGLKGGRRRGGDYGGRAYYIMLSCSCRFSICPIVSEYFGT